MGAKFQPITAVATTSAVARGLGVVFVIVIVVAPAPIGNDESADSWVYASTWPEVKVDRQREIVVESDVSLHTRSS